MPSGQTIHAEAKKHYQERGQLSNKDLMQRMGFNSVRSIQRLRSEYGLKPVGWWGINPLFAVEDVERVEKLLNKKRQATVARSVANANRCRLKLPTFKQARRAGRKARK
jgi:hypothetical protein